MSAQRISLLSGGVFDFGDLEQSQYTIEDIAHNLSNTCRFSGAVEKAYNVAQHSVLVSHVVPEEHALAGLMHDSSEAFLGDMTSPLKVIIPQYKKFEKKVEKFMFDKMNLPFPMHPAIKLADIKVFLAENEDLRGIYSDMGDITRYPKKIVPWTPARAKKEFLKRFEELTK